jgi:hypothetical protein
MKHAERYLIGAIALLATLSAGAAEVVPRVHRPYAFGSFAVVILMTLLVTWWASRKGNANRRERQQFRVRIFTADFSEFTHHKRSQ